MPGAFPNMDIARKAIADIETNPGAATMFVSAEPRPADATVGSSPSQLTITSYTNGLKGGDFSSLLTSNRSYGICIKAPRSQ